MHKPRAPSPPDSEAMEIGSARLAVVGQASNADVPILAKKPGLTLFTSELTVPIGHPTAGGASSRTNRVHGTSRPATS
ncbi:uncharacterized protein BO80DRAFT_207809 [Aspergillus ibericus CBS 121593]|uniref:Uncharacterized protein n=1 Tax=Aspergillus ibericus CBS 121593 TaxID=1448316 RepID=A0A395HAS1_9EURO|nr:hypothetical protein BO80DRAFT_207809 [Aspergillus ibericus CBS 121593]RAL04746.1 hypothetical protein BO80DRAFT_207809 [Aspergillus ibericus CBS 121593]